MIFSTLKSYIKKYLVNRTDEGKCTYLRGLGALVGNGTRFIGNANLGSEPYLVEIGDNCLISSNVLFHTHDGSVKVLNTVGFFGEQRMDKMARIKVGNNCFIGRDARIMGGGKDRR